MSKQDFHQPEKPLEKRRKLITNLEYQRMLKWKKKIDRNQKHITP